MHMKQFILILLALLLPTFVWAEIWQDPETKVNYEYTPGGATASVSAGDSHLAGSPDAQGNIVLLPKIMIDNTEYIVTSIGDYAFCGCNSLISIDIPDSVTSIGESAFGVCSSLTSVDIPNSVTSIGDAAFSGCSSLTSITIPNSVTLIGNGAFAVCSSLTSVDIPNSVTWIGNNVFLGCSSLTSVDIPNSVTWIGNDVFLGCSSLTSVTIGNSVTSIGDYAFHGCSSLTSVTIGNSVTSIGDYAFHGCSSLTSVTIGNSVTSIGDGAFEECSSLTSIDIPNSVTSIGVWAFFGCSSLTSIEIPNSVTSIGESAFSGCYFLTNSFTNHSSLTNDDYWGATLCDEETKEGLLIRNKVIVKCRNWATSIIIPNSVTSIVRYVFSGCSSLTSIIVESGNLKYDSRNDCNAIIETATNTLMAGCKTSIIPNSVTSIGWYAFYGCSSLTFVDIPNSVTSIGGYAFYGCSSLTSVAIPNSVTSIGELAFYGCSSLTSIDIPNSVTSIGDAAFGNCKNLKDIISEIVEPYDINSFDENIYSQATLYVPAGTIDAYQSRKGWKEIEHIEEIGGGKTIAINVTNEEGEGLTDKVSILWYDANGKEIGRGEKLNGIADSTEVYYSVLLDETLGRIYREVKIQKASFDEGTITCQLKKIGRVQLEGRVSATDIDKTTTTVTILQKLNGKYEQKYTTHTNEQGVFAVEVYDDETEITISGEGYLDATLHRDGFAGNGNIGTIPLNLISGFSIAANIVFQKAITEGEAGEATSWNDGLNNIEFSLTNATKNADITDFTVQNGNLIIKTGADVGDEIRLKATSKQGVFADATTSFTIADGANAFNLQLTELGGLDATCTASNNGSTIGYLYNSGGVLDAKGSYSGETLSLRHLQNGTYTLVSMGQSLLLGNMTRLDDIKAVGLNEGTNYVVTIVEVADGKLAKVNVDEVPRMDDTRFYYTSNDTYFSANKAAVTAGNYLTLQAHVDFKPEHADKADGITLTINLPEGCQMVENSVIANRQAVPHTVNGNRVAMTLNKEQYNSQVRFCIIPTLNQSYTVTAMAQFDIGGKVTQPIGTAQFEAKGLSLSVPEHVAKTNVTIYGTAKGHSEVSIYDNDVLIGKTASLADGSWTAECELFKPYSHSFHEIYAKITTENGMELTSEVRQVEYDKNGNVPETVTMLNWSNNVCFNLLQGTTTPSYYSYAPSYGDFTFLADFTRNDTTQIKNVNIKVLNTDGTVRTLPATFDGKQGKWVATTKYSSSSRLPKNVAVEYDCIPNSEIYDEEMDEAMTSIINNMLIEVQNAYKNCPIELNNEDENSISFMATTNGYETKENFRITLLKYEQITTQYTDEQVCHIVNDTTNLCFIVNTFDDNRSNLIVWDNLDKVAFIISTDDMNNVKSFGQRHSPVFLLNAIYGAGIAIYDYNMRMEKMASWTFEQAEYTERKRNNRMQQLLYAKCPDGTYKVKDNNTFHQLLDSTREYSRSSQKYLSGCQTMLEKQQQRLKQLCLLQGMANVSLSFLLGPVFKSIGSGLSGLGGTIANSLGRAMSNRGITALMELFSHSMSQIADMDNITINGETITPEEVMTKWYSQKSKQLTDEYVNIVQLIKNNYSDCKKEDKEEQEDEPKDDNKDDFKGEGSTAEIDPSGYVYEAVTSNRLEGVTVTCYQKVQTEDMYGDVTEEAVVWNAEDYSQQNPLKTDATGFYRWDVPQGWWQVKYEKEGYETAYSEWLPVPPPQLDVNIGMKQSTPPMVKMMRGYESGITIELSKYMRPETVTTVNVTVTRNGASEKGTIELLNAEKAPLGEETYVSKVKFVPETPFSSADLVVVTVHKEVESYCGVKMTKDHIETVKIEPEIKGIVADSLITVLYQGEKEMRIMVLPKEASSGKMLHVETSSQMIASISSTDVTIDKDGVAVLALGGELPGGAVITFSVDSTDVTATSKVRVVINSGAVEGPVASIRSGETVMHGTQLTLTCDTEGAQIYYTLDGSCPCDEQTRILYTGPFTLPDGMVTVKAMTVVDNMDDSDVATFVYTVLDRELIVFANSPMRTYSSAFPLYFTGIDGLNAYIASGYSPSDEVVIMRQVESVPARTGLLLVSNEANKSYEVPIQETDYVYSNLLVGVTENTEITDGYVLADGLFAAVEGSTTVKGGEAYLKIPATDKKQLKIRFTDTLNGVEDVKLAEDGKADWFTISGTRLNHQPTQRGIYLHGGKKVMVK